MLILRINKSPLPFHGRGYDKTLISPDGQLLPYSRAKHKNCFLAQASRGTSEARVEQLSTETLSFSLQLRALPFNASAEKLSRGTSEARLFIIIFFRI